MATENHHNIPISLYWEDIQENKFKVPKDQHRPEIHDIQDIAYKKIRRYKERTNWILIPTDIVIDWRIDLWREYFSKAQNFIFEQKNSLAKQVARYNYKIWSKEIIKVNQSFDDLVIQLWEKQKYLIKLILQWENTF